jgi:glycine/D-amino acid oxidase-like deaminating enzyme
MCSTPDGFPLIGELPDRPNQYIMAGFNGYGFSHALSGAMIIRDYIKDGKSSIPGARLFDPGRLLS